MNLSKGKIDCAMGAGMARSLFCWSLALCLVALGAPAVDAAMYMCRSKSGSIHFTNVRNSPTCVPYNLGKKRSALQRSPGYTKRTDRSQYDRDIRRIARRYKVEPSIIKAIIHVESDFDHQAVSKKGAQGLMQLMPGTSRELRVSNPFNPRENIDGGTRYFRRILDSFKGDLTLSLAAYNAGPGLVARTGGVPKIRETQRYVSKVLKQYKVYKAIM